MHVLYYPYEQGWEDGQEGTEDAQGPRDSHTHEGRFRAKPERNRKARQITPSKPEAVASQTAIAHRLGDYNAKHTHLGILGDV